MKRVVSLIFLLAALCFANGETSTYSMEEISKELVCQCGCGMVLAHCNHSDCGVGIPMRANITEKLLGGESREQIVAYFVSKYGEVVLSAPPKRGFNLTAWLLPFFGIAAGGGIVVLVIMGWLRHRRQSVEVQAEAGPKASHKHEDVFERELNDFE